MWITPKHRLRSITCFFVWNWKPLWNEIDFRAQEAKTSLGLKVHHDGFKSVDSLEIPYTVLKSKIIVNMIVTFFHINKDFFKKKILF